MKYLKLYESYSIKTIKDFIEHYNIQNHARSLDCVNRDIESLDGIENLTNLVYLYCSYNKIKFLKGIENLTKLEILNCGLNELTSLSGIENCIELRKLGCYKNSLENLDEIKNLPKLHMLTCYDNCWEFPLEKELVNKFKIGYSGANLRWFKTYESQKAFLTKYPERYKELIEFGINEKIPVEFPHVAPIVRGTKWGFFDLERSSV